MKKPHEPLHRRLSRKIGALDKLDLAGNASALISSVMRRRPAGMERPTHADLSLRRHLIVGAATAALLVGGLGTWAATTELSGAVIVSGHVVVESHVKDVQHPTGGVVGVLNVRNGDNVEAGDVLVELDDTLTRSNLAMVTKSLDELSAREARLAAEREGSEDVAFDPDLTSRSDTDHVKRSVEGEQKLFALRRAAREGEIEQRRKRVEQLHEEISGFEAQEQSKVSELALTLQELESVKKLWEQKLIQHSRLLELERNVARLEGERGQLVAAIAQTRGKISETELAIIQVEQTWRSDVADELRETETRIARLEEQKIAADELLRQTDIRAPQSGRVYQLSVHSEGGVIRAGEAIMKIVPSADELTIEARVAPQDIDQVRPDQPVFVRMSAFSQQSTPELEGKVSAISPDLMIDERTGEPYYGVRIRLPEDELESLGSEKLKPGMPVEAFLRTSDRTVVSYLMKPLSDQINRAFRE